MKKNARIIITNSAYDQASDDFVEKMLIKAIFSDAKMDGAIDGVFSEEMDCDEFFSEVDAKGRSGRTTVSVIGEIEESDGVVNIRYPETEITNMAGAETLISFSDPDEVTMVRTGSVRTALCFNRALERRVCWYNESVFPVDVSVITERFKNTLNIEKGGILDVIYSVEMKGLPMENSHFTVQVKIID